MALLFYELTNPMTLEQAVLVTLGDLLPDKKQAVLDFAKFLRSRTQTNGPRRSIQGLCADLNFSISSEEIEEARKHETTR